MTTTTKVRNPDAGKVIVANVSNLDRILVQGATSVSTGAKAFRPPQKVKPPEGPPDIAVISSNEAHGNKVTVDKE